MCNTTLLGTDTKDFMKYPGFRKLLVENKGSNIANTMILSEKPVLVCINFIYLPYTNVYYNSRFRYKLLNVELLKLLIEMIQNQFIWD